MMEVTRALVPAADQTPGQTVIDGKPAVQTNLLFADFIKPSFDRRRSSVEGVPPATLSLGDPSIEAGFRVLNDWIRRYKYLARSSNVRTIRPSQSFWALEYLTDDEKEIPADPVLFRVRTGFAQGFRLDILDSTVWDRVGSVPIEFKPHAWEVLLLDSPALLPEIGPALVLAYAALEAFIDWSLDVLAPLAKIPPTLWEWVNTRDSFWLRPRTAEQLDVLLESLTGKSLKSELKLWELFKNLASARHSYVHTGHAVIGNQYVTVERATELINGAGQVVTWIEALLPISHRRPELSEKHTITITTTIPLTGPVAGTPTADVGPKPAGN